MPLPPVGAFTEQFSLPPQPVGGDSAFLSCAAQYFFALLGGAAISQAILSNFWIK